MEEVRAQGVSALTLRPFRTPVPSGPSRPPAPTPAVGFGATRGSGPLVVRPTGELRVPGPVAAGDVVDDDDLVDRDLLRRLDATVQSAPLHRTRPVPDVRPGWAPTSRDPRVHHLPRGTDTHPDPPRGESLTLPAWAHDLDLDPRDPLDPLGTG